MSDTAMHTRAVQRLDFEAALRRAVIRQQFTVHYQPVVRLPSGELAGLEALVRRDHPERGLVMPGEFVSLAEDTGLIVPIGRWVLHAACQAARDWQRRFPLQPHAGAPRLPPRPGLPLRPPLDQFAVEALLVAEQGRRPSPARPRLPVV